MPNNLILYKINLQTLHMLLPSASGTQLHFSHRNSPNLQKLSEFLCKPLQPMAEAPLQRAASSSANDTKDPSYSGRGNAASVELSLVMPFTNMLQNTHSSRQKLQCWGWSHSSAVWCPGASMGKAEQRTRWDVFPQRSVQQAKVHTSTRKPTTPNQMEKESSFIPLWFLKQTHR